MKVTHDEGDPEWTLPPQEERLDLDLDMVITDLPPDEQKEFLHAQKGFLDSLSPRKLATFNLSSEKLAKFRREASGR